MTFPPIQCLTLDGLAMNHTTQVRALCAAGAGWIQLRMKQASDDEVAAVVEASLPACRAAGCRLIVNDRVDVALRCGADGVHLGKRDMLWNEARERAGDRLLIGGTVNSLDEAEAAPASGCLDYTGAGPFRFTPNKTRLAPVLSETQWRSILAELDGLPTFAIGGIQADDLPRVRALGAQGAAVASCLYTNGDIAGNFDNLMTQWRASAPAMTQ